MLGRHLASIVIDDEILAVEYAGEPCGLQHSRHLGLESRCYGSADLTEILVLTLHNGSGADLIDSVNILIGAVVGQFKAHFRDQDDGDRHSHSQGQNLDDQITFFSSHTHSSTWRLIFSRSIFCLHILLPIPAVRTHHYIPNLQSFRLH